MTTTRINPRRHLILGVSFVGIAIVGTGLGFVATAHAGTLPMDGDTVAMTISNDTDQPMTLAAQYTNVGDFIAAPQQILAPHTSEIVTASNAGYDRMAAVMSYQLPDHTVVVFEANDFSDGANTTGTVTAGPSADHYQIATSLDTGFPNLNASYTLQSRMLGQNVVTPAWLTAPAWPSGH
ncbi:hypothetical protein [Smaragdicoccus niigatensis]|uniref:hypothetical protein n=1 Tax=Smaragdicoccus niigatensis TaxID=359359 RepID=UPI0003619FF0|nr:hypothetical protein [Smaragdicoccus niigatensis]